jgi:hypothetical protein
MLIFRFIIPIVFTYVKRKKQGLSKTQLSCYSIYCGDSDYMFRPCLAIFGSQCSCRAQMRKTPLYVGLVRCCGLSGVDATVASTPDRMLHICSPQKPSPLEPHPHRTSPTQTAAVNQPDIQLCFFSFVHDINIVT